MEETQQCLLVVDQTFTNFQGHHYEYNMSLVAAAKEVGLTPVVLANEKCEITSEGMKIVPWFRFDWYGSERDGEIGVTFADELLNYLDQEQAGPADLVLVHTIALSEFTQLLSSFVGTLWHEAASFPTIYLILRRDPDEYTGAQLLGARAILNKAFACPDLDEKLILCTDTDELSEAWSSVFNWPFITLPIPFRHDLLNAATRRRSPQAPISLVYLGDARNEKGYQHLPSMVRAIWNEYVGPGLVECLFQSNYNLPDGEGGIPEARLRLQQYPHGVKLLTHQLTPEEYYQVLSDSDIVVLPYDPERYARRSSGILNEAVIAGKVVVAPQGTWLAAQVSEAGAVVYDHPSGLPAAVIQALDNVESLSKAARLHAPTHAARHSAAALIEALLAHANRAPSRTSPVVLYVMDGDSVVNRSGAGAVAANQLGALTELGYRVHAVFQRMHVDNDHNILAMRQWMERVCEEVRPFPLASVWGTGYAPFTNRMGLIPEREVLKKREGDFNDVVRYRASFNAPSGLVEALRRDPPDVVLVNYVQSVLFARELAGPEVPVICESHDVQSFQIAMRRGRGLRQRDLDSETALLSQADHVIALNPFEKDFLGHRLGHDKVTFIPQPIREPAVTAEAMAGATDLVEIIEACGPTHPLLHRDSRGGWPANSPMKRLRGTTGIDLLYISSRHRPNEEGFRLFMHHVYFPMLASLGVNIVIAGDICEDLHDLQNPHIFPVYRLKTLAPLYAAAKVVVIPILEGAGSAIKTIEALAHGKPVVATSFALRGIRFDPRQFPVFDEWDSLGARIMELLSNPPLREIASEQSRELGRRNGCDGRYADRLNDIFRAVIGPKALPNLDAVKTNAANHKGAVEWSDSLAAYNRLMRDWLTDGCLTIEALRAFQENPIERDVAERIFRALAVRRDTPAQKHGVIVDSRYLQIIDPESEFGKFWTNITQSDRPASAMLENERELLFRVPHNVEADIRVELDGRPPEVVWRSRGTNSGNSRQGVCSVPRPNGTAILTQRFRQSARSARGGGPIVFGSGFHEGELINGRHGPSAVARWTGPQSDAFASLALDNPIDTLIVVEVLDAIEWKLFEGAALSLNGLKLPTLKWSENHQRQLTALLPAAVLGQVRGRVRLGIHTGETLQPAPNSVSASDPRHLGLMIGEIRTETDLSSGSVRNSKSTFGETLMQMIDRGPEHFIYACYRDLLLREPDSEGLKDYSDRLRSDGHSFVLEALLFSAEFRSKFEVPGYADAIASHVRTALATNELALQ